MRQVLCPVLVSRDGEVRRLTAALAAAQSGRGGTVLVTGEAGIGKSRLVRETAHLARDQETAVLAGRPGARCPGWRGPDRGVRAVRAGGPGDRDGPDAADPAGRRRAVRVYDGSWAE